MPRNGRPPKIAHYRGRTFLSQWLGSVVTNHCLSALRTYRPEGLEHDRTACKSTISPEAVLDRAECQQLLQPILQAALAGLTSDDCLLIKLLTLDGVPQGQVARALGMHSGSSGRQRDMIDQGILKRLWDAAPRRSQETHFKNCFDSLLSGNDPVPRDWIVRELVSVFGSDSRQQGSAICECKYRKLLAAGSTSHGSPGLSCLLKNWYKHIAVVRFLRVSNRLIALGSLASIPRQPEATSETFGSMPGIPMASSDVQAESASAASVWHGSSPFLPVRRAAAGQLRGIVATFLGRRPTLKEFRVGRV